MNTLLLQLTQSFVREPHTQQPREGYYSALITRIQTGVKPREKGAPQLYQKWKAALCHPFPQQPVHRIRRTFSVSCQGFCVHCAVNCICFKVWGVSQGENGRGASPNAHINSKSGRVQKVPCRRGPTLTTAPSGSHTVINRRFKDGPQLRNSCRKSTLLSEAVQRAHISAHLHHKLRSWSCYNVTTPGYAAIVQGDIGIA